MLPVERSSETGLLREWSIEVFDNLYFRKHISYDDLLFLENLSNLM